MVFYDAAVEPDSTIVVADPLSLARAVRAVAHRHDQSIDLDTLITGMALPWMDCAVPAEPDPAKWPLYARDAFLESTCRLLGLTIRGIHPPEASRGLRAAPEFDQHFDASYRPLIIRAVQHGQPVLAWQGWPGPYELAWGIVENVSDRGTTLTGRIIGSDGRGEETTTCVLERPALQVYVIEAMTQTAPSPGEVWSLVCRNARTALDNGLSNRFGITTGPAAYDPWLDLPSSPPALAALCASSALGHEAAVRYLERVSSESDISEPGVARALRDRCREVAAAMRNLANAERMAIFLETDDGRRYTSSMLRSAQAASRSMLEVLTA